MRIFTWVLVTVVGICSVVAALSYRREPPKIIYGVTFTKFFADELGLDWKKVYLAILDDLKVRHFRLAAHWPMIEPERDTFDFSAMDFQIAEASKRHADIILAVGRRLPRWPECHTPKWVGSMPWDEEKKEIRDYIEAVVDRYKDETAITAWQVENEPYLHAFAGDICGELDERFLEEEVALVKKLDPSRPVLLTDSGNLGLWYGPYSRGDMFGTSVYVYFWTPELGQFKTIQPASLYRIKINLMRLIFGSKPAVLIELSGEPWLTEPITNAPIETQLSRMDIEKFRDILAYAKSTRFEKQYLWGPEWWYYMKDRNHPEFWNLARTLFAQ